MMQYLNIPDEQFEEEKKYLISSVFKLLPYKQEKYLKLDDYFESILQRMIGFNKISGFQPVTLTVISLLEYARTENNYDKYRKSILDACSLIDQIKSKGWSYE